MFKLIKNVPKTPIKNEMEVSNILNNNSEHFDSIQSFTTQMGKILEIKMSNTFLHYF
jgi:hypothetical protein